MKLTTALIKDYIGNNILGVHINIEDRLDDDEMDLQSSSFLDAKYLFNNKNSWVRQSKYKFGAKKLNIFDFIDKQYQVHCDYGDIVCPTDLANLIAGNTINDCIVRNFTLKQSVDLGEYHSDYLVSILSDPTDSKIIAWFANAD